jgi:hypothetical protein
MPGVNLQADRGIIPPDRDPTHGQRAKMVDFNSESRNKPPGEDTAPVRYGGGLGSAAKRKTRVPGPTTKLGGSETDAPYGGPGTRTADGKPGGEAFKSPDEAYDLEQPTPEDDEIENEAQEHAETLPPTDYDGRLIDFLQLVREAEEQALLYVNQVNRKAWTQSLRAFHNEHFIGSKYTKPDYRNRSRFFVSKTRSAVWKDMAAAAASIFSNVNAIDVLPGDESDPKQTAAAAVMEELVNYRTDRSSGKAAIPWFMSVMGARQDCLLTGVCLSKQSWRFEVRPAGESDFSKDEQGEDVEHPKYVIDIDRPDCQVIPPENYIIDPGADWKNPVQSAQYVIIKWPMHIDDVKKNINAPFGAWKPVLEDVLLNSVENGKFDMAAIRRGREQGLDRLDETQTGTKFRICWIYEVYMRQGGEDWTFLSVGDQAFLTDPKPVREVYPEQNGERPLTLGFGSLEAHRIYPMAPVESWQMLQYEINDIRNLTLDVIKQNAFPVTKVVRGRQIDLDQIKRRSSGSSIIVQNKDDVTWERPPDVPQSIPIITRELELEFDDLAGQFNSGTTENNNALSRTLGGLKLVAGAANAVQEYNIRVWIETWLAPTIAQIVKLEQWYESDPIILGLCGQRAKLMMKHGINKIDDDLMAQEVTTRVSVGLGAGDPQQRLQKFSAAAQIALPILQQAPQFQSGELTINPEAVMQEIFGAAGYRDGGARFITKGQPKPPNPMQQLEPARIQSEIEKNKASAMGARMTGVAKLAHAETEKRRTEMETLGMLLGHHRDASDMGHRHGSDRVKSHLEHVSKGHEHGLAVAQHHHEVGMDNYSAMLDAMNALRPQTPGGDVGGQGGLGQEAQMPPMGPAGPPQSPPQQAAPAAPPQPAAGAPPSPQQTSPQPGVQPGMGGAPQPNLPPPIAVPQGGGGMAPPPAGPPVSAAAPGGPSRRVVRYDFIRDHSGRIVSARPVYADEEPPPGAEAGGNVVPYPLPPPHLRGGR